MMEATKMNKGELRDKSLHVNQLVNDESREMRLLSRQVSRDTRPRCLETQDQDSKGARSRLRQ